MISSGSLATGASHSGMGSSFWPRLGVGVLVFRDQRFLLIRRGQEPYLGQWTPPGGKVENGETVVQAGQRELLEECGIYADRYRFVDYFEFIDKDNPRFPYHYVVLDFIAEYESGDLQIGSDVLDAAWFRSAEVAAAAVTPATKVLIKKAMQLRSA